MRGCINRGRGGCARGPVSCLAGRGTGAVARDGVLSWQAGAHVLAPAAEATGYRLAQLDSGQVTSLVLDYCRGRNTW